MTSLSKLSDDPRYAQRFELYIGGLEIANAFGELTDAGVQARNLEADKNKRKELRKETWSVDPDFIAALESGISSAGGIALGVDRMVLLFTGAKDLNEVMFQSVHDQLT
jgi:lysyl-tRNA synthetase class 2